MVMNTSFFSQVISQSHWLRGILFVIIAICFIWAVIYSKHSTLNFVNPLLRGILLVTIAVCLLVIITGGVSPNPLTILGIAIVCLSFIPKPLEKERDND